MRVLSCSWPIMRKQIENDSMRDVIVIGGGPAGNKVASLLAKDHSVLVVEEHNVTGHPVQCTGLVSDEVIELSGVRPTILNKLYGANIFFPCGASISLRSKDHKAVLIDRYEFDGMMVTKASDAGAEHVYSTRFLRHNIEKGVSAVTDRGSLTSRMLIGADGHNSRLAKSIPGNRPAEYVRGIQADIRRTSEDQEMLNIRIGSKVAPGFFSWEIPFGDMIRVGLCTSWDAGPPSEYLKLLVKKIGFNEDDIVKKYSGRIPLGGQKKTYADNLLLVGDAACQVKPISGGGLQPAFRSSYCLAETVREAFDSNDFSERSLSVYEKRWKREIGRELKRGYRLRKVYNGMSDRDLDKVLRIADRRNIKEIFNEGSIDHPSDLLLPVLNDPITAVRLLPLLTKAMVRGIK